MEKKLISKIFFIITLLLLAIVLLLIFEFDMRIFKINGNSMNPTLKENEIVLSFKDDYERNDMIAFKHNQAIMIKRIIGLPNDKIDITKDGTVYVNNIKISEPYIKEKSLGSPEIKFPYKVPEDSYFVLGDNRAHSLDSRNIPIGSINKKDIIGKVKLSLIPFNKF